MILTNFNFKHLKKKRISVFIIGFKKCKELLDVIIILTAQEEIMNHKFYVYFLDVERWAVLVRVPTI